MRAILPLLGLIGLLAAGCTIPAHGTPVFVDMRAGKFWSGKGQLLEVSADEQQCLVSIRGRALLVSEQWVRCDSVHPRHSRDHF